MTHHPLPGYISMVEIHLWSNRGHSFHWHLSQHFVTLILNMLLLWIPVGIGCSCTCCWFEPFCNGLCFISKFWVYFQRMKLTHPSHPCIYVNICTKGLAWFSSWIRSWMPRLIIFQWRPTGMPLIASIMLNFKISMSMAKVVNNSHPRETGFSDCMVNGQRPCLCTNH